MDADIPWAYRLRDWLARHLPRWLAIALAIRRVSPRAPWDTPSRSYQVTEAGDTGGGYRAPWRPQDPSLDPREPGGGESSSAGTDHGWSNCTVASGAMALAYQQPRGALVPWGGDLRHRQGDLSGGTDLYDVREAWASYGETLTIRTGAGWAGVDQAHDEGRAIVVQGEGNVPGSEAFDGGHGCVIAPETHSNGQWLFGDPLASGWQWVSASSIKTWMAAWDSGYAFAIGEAPPPPKPPDPEPPKPPTPPPPPPGPGYAAGYQAGHRDGRNAEADATFGSWLHASQDPDAIWDRGTWAGAATTPAWTSWPIPLQAVAESRYPAAWDDSGWTASLWRG